MREPQGYGHNPVYPITKAGDNMDPMLTAQEVAELIGRTPKRVKQMAKEGKLGHTFDDKYLFPLSALEKYDARYVAQYYESQKLQMIESAAPDRAAGKPDDQYTAKQREEIAFWMRLLKEWQEYRNRPGKKKTERDKDFVAYCRVQYPELQVSKNTLYRKWDAMKNDIDGLVDKRGQHLKDKSSVPPEIFQVFLSFFLDEAQHPIARCIHYTKLYAQEEFPELADSIPSYSSFYRRLEREIPEAVSVLGREGEKAFNDRCAPYIRRTYDDMASNEWWIADNHTFDIITEGENGQQHRLYLTAFFDARGEIFTGCYVTTAPSSQATLIALRKGILQYGIPDNIYVDNGREFLTFDIGGLGHRTKKSKSGEEPFTPPPIFERLGIKMTNAIVRNAKAKIIERRFRDIKDQLSRLFETYTGGNVVERPEYLKKALKAGRIPSDAELTAAVEQLLEWYFNQQAYGGAVKTDHGKPRMQVYNENLKRRRTASAEELNLMLMRSTRPQTVKRRGVSLKIGGKQLDYWNDEMLLNLQGKKVYFRYDPENLGSVRLYDLDDRFIMEVPVDNEAVSKYGASQNAVKAAMKKVKRMEKVTKEALEYSVLPAIGKDTALQLVLAEAERKKAAGHPGTASPQVLELQRAIEEPLLPAVGDNFNADRLVRNATRRQGGHGNE